MSEFKIEVPIDVKSSTSGDSGGGGGGGVGFKKLTGAVLAGNILTKIIASALEGLMKVIAPLTKMLSLLFFIVFLPLMPIVIALTKALAGIITGIMKLFKGEINIFEFIKSFLFPALLTVANGIIEYFKNWGKILWDGIIKPIFEFGMKIGQWLYDAILKPIFDFGAAVGGWLYSAIIQPIINGLLFFVDLGVKIWEAIKSGLSFIGNLGRMIWDWIKNALKSIGSFVGGLFGGKRAAGGPVSSGSSYLVGENGPEMFTPSGSGSITPNGAGGAININVTGNNFQSEQDMRRLVDMISRRLQQLGNRGFSPQ